ncbi:MAG TPA: hypothetical protein PLV68_04325 [Ilumatobacteraceae bacterium]|nr:hypothetical protein [Ilumatobacteraceae bacterium]
MSTTGGCLAVEHAGVDESVLADAIRTNLHGTATYGAEVVMVSIDPLVVDLHCCHGAHH